MHPVRIWTSAELCAFRASMETAFIPRANARSLGRMHVMRDHKHGRQTVHASCVLCAFLESPSCPLVNEAVLKSAESPLRYGSGVVTAKSMARTKAQKAKANLSKALAEFHLHYGKDETNLEKWQQLCDDCAVIPADSITKCKKVSLPLALPSRRSQPAHQPHLLQALSRVAINIWDLIEAGRSGNLPAPRFANKTLLRQDLADRPQRRFPLSKIKGDNENRILRAFLVTVG